MNLNVLICVGVLMSADGGASGAAGHRISNAEQRKNTFGFTPSISSGTKNTSPEEPTSVITSFPSPSPAAGPAPAVLNLRGGKKDTDAWGPPDVFHTYDLSRYIADCPSQQVILQHQITSCHPYLHFCCVPHNNPV
jgi:hypothetical protein